MTSEPESTLFDFATSKRQPQTEDEKMLTEIHSALGTSNVPIRLMRPPIPVPAANWRRYLNAAVAALLVIALIGASVNLLAPDTRNDQNNHTSVPPVVLGLASPDSETHSLSVSLGNPAPDFTLTTFSGEEITLSSQQGKIVVVNFWGSWCAPCRADMPTLQRISETSSDDVVVVGIGSNQDSEESSRELAEILGITYPIGFDTEGSIASDYGVTDYPVTVVIDPNGRVSTVLIGGVNESELEHRIQNARTDLAIATPGTTATCDFEADTPIIMGANSTPFDTTSLLLTTSGELKLICADDESTLATNVEYIFPTSVPNTVMAETTDGMRIVNIASGDSLDFPYSTMVVLQNQSLTSFQGSWMIAPSTDDQNMASIYDLRTLDETPLAFGVSSDEQRIMMTAVTGLSVNSTDTHAAVAASFQHSSSSRYLQGFLIVDEAGNMRSVRTQPDVVPRTIAISPDGETIATSWYQGTMEHGETNISLYDASNGEVIESWMMQTGDIQTELTWLDDGSGIVFTDENALYLIDAEHPGDGFRILHEGPDVSGILLTPDPKVVAVSTTSQSQAGPPSSQTVIVNTETGDTILLDGRDLWAGSFGPASKRTVLVLLDFFSSHSADSLTMTVVDAVTGEEIGEIEHNPPAQMSISNASSQLPRGDVNIFAMGPNTVWQLLDAEGQPALQEISLPVSRDSLNSDGILISMDSEGRIALTLMDPFTAWMWIPDGNEGEWIQLDVAMPDTDLGLPIVVLFIPGSE